VDRRNGHHPLPPAGFIQVAKVGRRGDFSATGFGATFG
jgi:hypothetical protein